MNNRMATMLFLVATLTMLSLLAFSVRVAVTADSVAVLKTTGMTCGSCSSRVSKALETLHGVAVTEVDVEGGWVIVGYDTKTVKPEALAAQVRSTGFESSVHQVLSPGQFRQITGRDIGAQGHRGAGCCGGKGSGCGTGST